MTAKTSFNMVMVVLLAFVASVAVAADLPLFEINDPSIVGNGMVTQDEFKLTRDPNTVLNRSYDDVLARSYEVFSRPHGREEILIARFLLSGVASIGPTVTLTGFDLLRLAGDLSHLGPAAFILPGRSASLGHSSARRGCAASRFLHFKR